MKKYLLLVEDETLWDKFKSIIEKDINSEIIELIKEKISKKGRLEASPKVQDSGRKK